MRLFILLLCLVILSAGKKPGSGPAFLKCKSPSGKTIFNATIEDITGLLDSAELIIENKKISFEYPDDAFTIFDPKNGVFTMHINGKLDEEFPNHKYIQIWAIPSTFKIINSSREKQKYEFKAKMFGTEPRKGKSLLTPEIELNCVLEYEI